MMRNLLLAILAIVSIGRADVDLRLNSVSQSESDFAWSYNAAINRGDWMNSGMGDGFIIYNVFGFTGTCITPINWTCTSYPDGVTTDIGFSYTAMSAPVETGPVDLGTFMLSSSSDLSGGADLLFISTMQDQTGGYVYTRETINAPAGPSTVPVPDPASLILLGTAAFGAGLVLKKRVR